MNKQYRLYSTISIQKEQREYPSFCSFRLVTFIESLF